VILPLAGALACANRGMQAPSIDSVMGTGSDDGASAGLDGSPGSGGAGGIAAAGGATGAGGAAGANTGGGAGLANTGGAGGDNVGGGAGRANTGGIGGQTNTGGAAGANTGGIGGRTNTGGVGGVNAGGKGGATTGGVGGASSGGVGGASSGGVGGASGGGVGGASGGVGGQTLPPLFAYYPFDQTAGPAIPDASGNGHGGTLAGAATFPAGVIGNGLSLPGVSGDYVALPSALLQTVTSVTIALWVNVRADQAWQRVFDFGSSTNVYMFLTPHAGGTSFARFAITTSGNATATEQRLDAPGVLPVGTWTHVAIVLGAGGGTFYINGAVAGSNAALTLRPADLGATTNNWIGRSQFTADPSFNGQIDDLRIYASALTAGQITTIYNAR
jgi:hypothetical protein